MLCKKHFGISFFLLLFLLFIPFSTSAVGFDGISAFPANPQEDNELTKQWFIYELAPGEEKKDALIIQNDSNHPVQIDIYAVDSTINEVGGLALKEKDEDTLSVGSWITIEEPSINLAPQEEKEVSFTVAISQDANVGEHFGGIIIETSNEFKKQLQASGLQVPTRMALRVYETVPGTLKKELSLNSFSNLGYWDSNANRYHQTFSYDIENTGTTNVEAKLTLSYSNYLFGLGNNKEEKTITLARDANISESFDLKVPKLGFFKSFLRISYENELGEQKVIDSSQMTFFSFPWIELIILLAILLFIVLYSVSRNVLLQIKKRRMNIYEVEEGDDIMLVAEKTETPWKKIVAYNRIKKPYALVPGTALYVYCADIGEEIDIEEEEDTDEEYEVETTVAESEPMEDITSLKTNDRRWPSWMKLLMIFLIIIIVISLIFLIFFSIQNRQIRFSLDEELPAASVEMPEITFKVEEPKEEIEILPEEIIEEAEEIPSILPKDVTVHVFNGTAIGGKAGELQKQLIELEYDVPVIGNADTTNSGLTSIIHSPAMLEHAQILRKSLEELDIETSLTQDDGEEELDHINLIIGSQGLN